MKLSAKSRYALVALTAMAAVHKAQERTTLISLSARFNISKIYLEQVFSLLKRVNLVVSIKGAQGGYLLQKSPDLITIYDIVQAVEPALFLENDQTVLHSAPAIEEAMKTTVFSLLDDGLKKSLSSVTLSALVLEAEKNNKNYMYYL